MKMKSTARIVNDFEDATVVAFLALRGHIVTPLRSQSGRIIFQVEGDISRDVEDFYLNQPVGVMDYVRTLKGIKSQIFTLKTLRRDENRG